MVWMPTLFVCFGQEDVDLYCRRLLNSFVERKKGYNLIEYNFYIDNMPVQGLHTFSEHQINSLFYLITSEKKFSSASGKLTAPFAKPSNNPLCVDMMDAVK
jgi:hypothetical protein